MPSAGAAGPIQRLLRIGSKLSIINGGNLTFDEGSTGTVSDGATVTVDEGGSFSIDGGLFRFIPQATPPTLPEGDEEGHVYMDTDHKLMVHNGTAWAVIGGQS